MTLSGIKTAFQNKKLSKEEYIDRMYEKHLGLFEYSSFLPGSGITGIELNNSGVIMSAAAYSADKEIKLGCVKNDKRTTLLEILNFGAYEEADSKMLCSLIDKNDSVFDIGANIGWYTLNFSLAAPEGVVYSFEPIPETYSRLLKNVSLNAFPSLINPFNIALSGSDGEATFYYNPNELGAASARNIRELKEITEVKCITQTLDSFVIQHNISKMDLIKCDVEGSELFVFKGGIRSLEKFKPAIFTEMLRKWAAQFQYHPNDIINLLASIGYSCYACRNNKLVEINRIDPETIETNFFFLDKGKHGEKITKHS